jgi:predicted Zn finger-like uncharacterized protein
MISDNAIDTESPMLITCTHCSTSYNIEPSSLGPAGRSVRCIRCSHVWFVANTFALAAIAEEHRADLAAGSGSFEVPHEGAAAEPAEPAENAAWSEQAAHRAADETGLDEWPRVDEGFAEGGPGGPEAIPKTEPVTIHDAPSIVPASAADRPATTAKREREDIETVAARRLRKSKQRRSGNWRPGLGTAILALAAINLGLVAWRHEIVRLMPQTATLFAAIRLPVNLRGLSLVDVQTSSDKQDGVGLLTVEGSVVNTTSRPVDVPRLRYSLRNEGGREIYNWTALPAKSVLAPGETLPFRSRVASPPPESHMVFVRFINRRDLIVSTD